MGEVRINGDHKMDSDRARLSIRLRDDSGDTVVFVNAVLDTLLRDLVAEVLRRLRIPDPPSEWALAYGEVSVPLDMRVGCLCEMFTEPSEATVAIELAITRCDSVHKAVAEDPRSVDRPQTVETADRQQNHLADETESEECFSANDDAFESGYSPDDVFAAAFDCEADDFELGDSAELADAAPTLSPVTRQSTVRYFSKMNP